eukprot:s1717_g13.t1
MRLLKLPVRNTIPFHISDFSILCDAPKNQQKSRVLSVTKLGASAIHMCLALGRLAAQPMVYDFQHLAIFSTAGTN